MNIYEATTRAVEEDMAIRRCAPGWEVLKILPTDSSEGFLLSVKEGGRLCPRWQPQAKDIMASDWVLVPWDEFTNQC